MNENIVTKDIFVLFISSRVAFAILGVFETHELAQEAKQKWAETFGLNTGSSGDDLHIRTVPYHKATDAI